MTKAEIQELLEEVLETNSAVLFGQLTKHFARQLKAEIEPLRVEIDQIRTMLDADTKRSETDEQERLMISNQVDRHEGWIGQIADATNTKLAPSSNQQQHRFYMPSVTEKSRRPQSILIGCW